MEERSEARHAASPGSPDITFEGGAFVLFDASPNPILATKSSGSAAIVGERRDADVRLR